MFFFLIYKGLVGLLIVQVAGSFWLLVHYIPESTFWEMSLLIGIPQKALRFKVMSLESLRSSICADSQTPLVKRHLIKMFIQQYRNTAKVSPAKINTLTSLKASVIVATFSTMLPNSGELCDKHSIEVALI